MTKEAPRNTRKPAPKPASRRAGETPTAAPVAPKPASNRAERAAERLDDVARRAGVAKGTIYLHFKDKESMFEELIRTAIVPLLNRLDVGPPPAGGSVRDMIEGFVRTFIHEVTTTRRGDIVRLIVAEG